MPLLMNPDGHVNNSTLLHHYALSTKKYNIWTLESSHCCQVDETLKLHKLEIITPGYQKKKDGLKGHLQEWQKNKIKEGSNEIWFCTNTLPKFSRKSPANVTNTNWRYTRALDVASIGRMIGRYANESSNSKNFLDNCFGKHSMKQLQS